jgi:hypothetical protein
MWRMQISASIVSIPFGHHRPPRPCVKRTIAERAHGGAPDGLEFRVCERGNTLDGLCRALARPGLPRPSRLCLPRGHPPNFSMSLCLVTSAYADAWRLFTMEFNRTPAR